MLETRVQSSVPGQVRPVLHVSRVGGRPTERRNNNNDIVLLLRNNSNSPYFRRVRRASPSTIGHRSIRRMRKQPTRSRLDVSKRVTGNSPAFGRRTIRYKRIAREKFRNTPHMLYEFNLSFFQILYGVFDHV